ncbi:Hypothetical protein RLITU_2917 [Romboutsia lituseburensis]|nr:Hypothetical protein RLITU_2917 [Romboutsia lituseburensis]
MKALISKLFNKFLGVLIKLGIIKPKGIYYMGELIYYHLHLMQKKKMNYYKT